MKYKNLETNRIATLGNIFTSYKSLSIKYLLYSNNRLDLCEQDKKNILNRKYAFHGNLTNDYAI